MLAKKKKLSKKQIKEDKLVTSYYQIQKFYEDNQSKIFIVGAALVIVILAVLWYVSKIEQDNIAATTELTRVMPIYNEGSYLEAIEGKAGTNIIGLQEIVSKYSGSDQGEVARIYLANSLFFTEQIEKALEEYDNYSGSNPMLAASALAGKAACYETKSLYAEAAKNYLLASEVEKYNPQNPDYLLNAGRNFIKADDFDNAEEALTTLKKEYKSSQAAKDADNYMNLLES